MGLGQALQPAGRATIVGRYRFDLRFALLRLAQIGFCLLHLALGTADHLLLAPAVGLTPPTVSVYIALAAATVQRLVRLSQSLLVLLHLALPGPYSLLGPFLGASHLAAARSDEVLELLGEGAQGIAQI